jgi:hypothetical protein
MKLKINMKSKYYVFIVIFLIFTLLKIFNIISWPWLIILTSPIWVVGGTIFLILIIAILIAAISIFYEIIKK